MAMKRERKTLRNFCKENNYYVVDEDEKVRHLTELDRLCEILTVDALAQLNKDLADSGREREKKPCFAFRLSESSLANYFFLHLRGIKNLKRVPPRVFEGNLGQVGGYSDHLRQIWDKLSLMACWQFLCYQLKATQRLIVLSVPLVYFTISILALPPNQETTVARFSSRPSTG